MKGAAREAWGNVKDAGNALAEKARVVRLDAEATSDRSSALASEDLSARAIGRKAERDRL